MKQGHDLFSRFGQARILSDKTELIQWEEVSEVHIGISSEWVFPTGFLMK